MKNFFKNITPTKVFFLVALGQFILIFLLVPFTGGYSLLFLPFTPIGALVGLVVALLYKFLFTQEAKNEDNFANPKIKRRNYLLSILLYFPSLLVVANELIATSFLNTDSTRFILIGEKEIDLYALPVIFFIVYLCTLAVYYFYSKLVNKEFSSGANVFNISVLDLILFCSTLFFIGLGASESGGKIFHDPSWREAIRR